MIIHSVYRAFFRILTITINLVYIIIDFFSQNYQPFRTEYQYFYFPEELMGYRFIGACKLTYILRLLLISIFFTFPFINVNCQTKWSPLGAKWYYNYQELLTYNAHGYKLFVNIGDTIINNRFTEIIQETFYRYDGEEFKRGNKYISFEDNMLYLYNGDEFELIFDFNLNKNDTLKIDMEIQEICDSVSAIIIDSTSTLNYNGFELKSVHASYIQYYNKDFSDTPEKFHYTFTERIGSERSFMYMPKCQFDDYFGNTDLRCYEDKEIGTVKGYYWNYFHEDEPCDTLINDSLTIFEDIFINNGILIYPNPVTDKLNIINNHNDINLIRLYNLQGKLLLELPILTTLSINLNNYPSGLYIIKFIGVQPFDIKIIKQ